MRQIGLVLLVAAVGFAGVYGFSQDQRSGSAFASASCQIKGNISIDTGERIYHVPGQFYYDETRVSPEYGERWFCSEGEATTAGWRRSRR